jgi:hypothetical protein
MVIIKELGFYIKITHIYINEKEKKKSYMEFFKNPI